MPSVSPKEMEFCGAAGREKFSIATNAEMPMRSSCAGIRVEDTVDPTADPDLTADLTVTTGLVAILRRWKSIGMNSTSTDSATRWTNVANLKFPPANDTMSNVTPDTMVVAQESCSNAHLPRSTVTDIGDAYRGGNKMANVRLSHLMPIWISTQQRCAAFGDSTTAELRLATVIAPM